jgi:hypothetical protein
MQDLCPLGMRLSTALLKKLSKLLQEKNDFTVSKLLGFCWEHGAGSGVDLNSSG